MVQLQSGLFITPYGRRTLTAQGKWDDVQRGTSVWIRIYSMHECANIPPGHADIQLRVLNRVFLVILTFWSHYCKQHKVASDLACAHIQAPSWPEGIGSIVLHNQSWIWVVLLALAHLLPIAAGRKQAGINAHTHTCMRAQQSMLETMKLVLKLIKFFQVSGPVCTQLHINLKTETKHPGCREALSLDAAAPTL